MTAQALPTIPIGDRLLTVEDVLDLAAGRALPVLDPAPEVRRRIRASHEALHRRIGRGETIYGVTTGFGDSCETAVDPALAGELARNLVRYHGCGTGRPLPAEAAAAVIAARLATLARGHSAVREELLDALCALLVHRILPAIPEEGSVGASGDLTPLSYLAAVLQGEREVLAGDRIEPAAEALARAGLPPLTLGPKESLALMNGTSVMTALGVLAFERAKRLARAAATITAVASDALRGEAGHFDPRIHAAKPHPGQVLAARWIREHLAGAGGPRAARVQDRYSIRCAPHVIGVLLDALPWIRRTLEIELNGATDNPLVDPDTGEILHGGNFYGGHVAFAMDGLKSAVASVADLLDRQLALLCNPATSEGLPPNLAHPPRPGGVAHHGFKAVQITASALTAEALKATMPAASFSRSTECHNQDKVSMGTIAARDALRVLELAERVAAAALLAACRGVELRDGGCRPASRAILAAVRELVPAWDGDRRMDLDLAAVVRALAAGRLPVGAPEEP